MRRFIVGALAVLGGLLVLSVLGAVVAWHFLAPRQPAIAA